MKLISLDEFQEPTREYTGNAILYAGPGAGKTRTIAAKAEYLEFVEKLSPSKMLFLSFSKRASSELISRLPHLESKILTIHKFAKDRIKNCPEIVESSESQSILDPRKICMLDFLGVTLNRLAHWDEDYSLQEQISSILGAIDKHKACPDLPFSTFYEPALSHYENFLKKENLIDFNDMLALGIKELDKTPLSIEWLFIDEGHDTSMLQYEVIKRIKASNIWGVFSPHQMIYRWNGADERNMKKFEEDFKPRKFQLRNNWRSNKRIVNLLENLYVDNLVPKNDKEGKVKLKRFWKESLESREAKNICYEAGPDHLILARTNKQLISIAEKEPDLYKEFKFKYQTIHRSKGGSAETVVVIGCGGKYIPYYRSEDEEEEKNLLYVACSRAKTNLVLLYTGYPTYFLEEVLNNGK